jgi:hypothetical protein
MMLDNQKANKPILLASGYAQGQLASYQPKALFIKEVVVVEAGWPANKSELELGLSKTSTN